MRLLYVLVVLLSLQLRQTHARAKAPTSQNVDFSALSNSKLNQITEKLNSDGSVKNINDLERDESSNEIEHSEYDYEDEDIDGKVLKKTKDLSQKSKFQTQSSSESSQIRKLAEDKTSLSNEILKHSEDETESKSTETKKLEVPNQEIKTKNFKSKAKLSKIKSNFNLSTESSIHLQSENASDLEDKSISLKTLVDHTKNISEKASLFLHDIASNVTDLVNMSLANDTLLGNHSSNATEEEYDYDYGVHDLTVTDETGCYVGQKNREEDECFEKFSLVDQNSNQEDESGVSLEKKVCCALEEYEKCCQNAHKKANCHFETQKMKENLKSARLLISAMGNTSCSTYRGQCSAASGVYSSVILIVCSILLFLFL